MNRDDIIRMAREAGMIGTGGAANEIERLYREAILDALPRFAALAFAAGAAHEREECIAVIPPQFFELRDRIRARGSQA
jgi:hypothetical protein